MQDSLPFFLEYKNDAFNILHFTSRIRIDRKEQQNSHHFTSSLVFLFSFFVRFIFCLSFKDALPKMDFMCTQNLFRFYRICQKDKFCIFIRFVRLDFCITVMLPSFRCNNKVLKGPQFLCHKCIFMYANECHSKLSNDVHTLNLEFFFSPFCFQISLLDSGKKNIILNSFGVSNLMLIQLLICNEKVFCKSLHRNLYMESIFGWNACIFYLKHQSFIKPIDEYFSVSNVEL